jgi:N-6 DNA Methylase
MKPEASSRLYTREKRSGKLLVGKRTECFLVGACLPSIPNGETRACLRLFPENLYLLFPGDLKTVPGILREGLSSARFEGGAGETIRRNLLQYCNVHTMLRLPTGIFYAQGVKANVLFFDKYQGAKTERLWIYDLRTNMNFTLRTNPLTRAHLDDFVACYCPGHLEDRQESERFRSFSYEELLKRDKLSLDLFWLSDESLESADKLVLATSSICSKTRKETIIQKI